MCSLQNICSPAACIGDCWELLYLGNMPRRLQYVGIAMGNTNGVLLQACEELGRVVCAEDVPDRDSFVHLVLIRGHPLEAVLQFALSMRRNRRTRRSLADVHLVLRGEGLFPRWLRDVLNRSFSLYCLLRALAAPQLSRPSAEVLHGPHLSHRLRRLLATPGLFWESRASRASLGERAHQARQQLWDSVPGSGWVMWVDNFTRLRYVVDPSLGMQVMNATATALLRMRMGSTMEDYHMASVREVVNAVPSILDDVVRIGGVLRSLIEELHSNGPPGGRVRVPLDHVRDDEVAVQWSPYALLELDMGSLQGVLRLVPNIRGLHERAVRRVHLLVDEKIHLHLMRFCYGIGYQDVCIREELRGCPVLYGLWHPYKQLCLLVWRRYLPYLQWLVRGSMAPQTRVGLKPTLRSIEMLFAVLVEQCGPWTLGLAGRLSTLKTWHALLCSRLKALGFTPNDGSPPGQVLAETPGRVDAITRSVDRVHVPLGVPDVQEVRRMSEADVMVSLRTVRDQIFHLEQVVRLVGAYVPALFLLGSTVRECHYLPGWDPGSGRVVQEGLLMVLNLLLRVDPLEKALRSEYFRSVLYALATWSSAHCEAPMACFSEDPCEALLAQLGRSARLRPQRKTVPEVSDLWANVSPTGHPGVVRPAQLSSRTLRGSLGRRMVGIIGGAAIRPTFVAWVGGQAVAEAQMCWPVATWFPGGLDHPIDAEAVRRGMWAAMRLLLLASPPEEVATYLLREFTLRDPEEAVAVRRRTERAIMELAARVGIDQQPLLNDRGAVAPPRGRRAPRLGQREVLLE